MDKYNGDLITKGRERSNSSEKSFFIFFLSFNFQSTEQNKETKINALQRHKLLLLTHFIAGPFPRPHEPREKYRV